jgi:hypothetical protein
MSKSVIIAGVPRSGKSTLAKRVWAARQGKVTGSVGGKAENDMDQERFRRLHKVNGTIDGQRVSWLVARLWDLSRDLPVEEVPLSSLTECDRNMWFGTRGGPPTVRNVVSHFRRIAEADLPIPIILRPDGRIMDGVHRLAKAMLEGRQTI